MLRKTSVAVAVVSFATMGAALFSGTALATEKGKAPHDDDHTNVVYVINENTNSNTNSNTATATVNLPPLLGL